MKPLNKKYHHEKSWKTTAKQKKLTNTAKGWFLTTKKNNQSNLASKKNHWNYNKQTIFNTQQKHKKQPFKTNQKHQKKTFKTNQKHKKNKNHIFSFFKH